MRMVGTTSRGLRAPIIRQGDDLVKIVVDTVLSASKNDGFEVRDRDIVAMTEAIVARAQGNYAGVEDIATDIRAKFPEGTVGVIFPILSRNRFSICLRGIAMGAKKVVIMLSYPSDEVGNHLVSLDRLDEAGVNPYSDVLTEERYRELFGYEKHRFTGVDYVEFYRNLVEEAGAECEIIFAILWKKQEQNARSSSQTILAPSFPTQMLFSHVIFIQEKELREFSRLQAQELSTVWTTFSQRA